MKITFEGEAKELAALVRAVQERQEDGVDLGKAVETLSAGEVHENDILYLREMANENITAAFDGRNL